MAERGFRPYPSRLPPGLDQSLCEIPHRVVGFALPRLSTPADDTAGPVLPTRSHDRGQRTGALRQNRRQQVEPALQHGLIQGGTKGDADGLWG